jgi:hypothetical protein
MALGDGIRRNIASVDPEERAQLCSAFQQLNRRHFPGGRDDAVPGRVTFWFKQDEIHQATHVHRGPEFLPWHREIVNRLEYMLREINPQLSLHYWDWTQNPREIPNANLGGGKKGTLNLFTAEFMGYGGETSAPIGEPWLGARFYVPGANPHRPVPPPVSGNPADPPQTVTRFIPKGGKPASADDDESIVKKGDYAEMRLALEWVHDVMHGFVNMGGPHIAFRDPFVFLLHSNVDRLFARWQTEPTHPERLQPETVYGTESNLDVRVFVPVLDKHVIQNVNQNVEPWSTGHTESGRLVSPWCDGKGVPHNYKHKELVTPPKYDTNTNLAGMIVAYPARAVGRDDPFWRTHGLPQG